MELTNSSFKRSKWVEISDATQFGPRSNLVCDNVPLQLYICKLPTFIGQILQKKSKIEHYAKDKK